ncbi:MAG TPA: hypothetical protein VEB18_02865 [Candidatus Paceibacterota bacterium]|nr:hypothetical protein [Candidatus Paceibacterota bacterium]
MIRPVTRYCVYCKKTHAMSDARGPQNCDPVLDLDDPLMQIKLRTKIPEELVSRGRSPRRRPPKIK